jgi:hypothetical protein
MAPLLEGMPGEDELPADVRALLERERTPT